MNQRDTNNTPVDPADQIRQNLQNAPTWGGDDQVAQPQQQEEDNGGDGSGEDTLEKAKDAYDKIKNRNEGGSEESSGETEGGSEAAGEGENGGQGETTQAEQTEGSGGETTGGEGDGGNGEGETTEGGEPSGESSEEPAPETAEETAEPETAQGTVEEPETAEETPEPEPEAAQEPEPEPEAPTREEPETRPETSRPRSETEEAGDQDSTRTRETQEGDGGEQTRQPEESGQTTEGEAGGGGGGGSGDSGNGGGSGGGSGTTEPPATTGGSQTAADAAGSGTRTAATDAAEQGAGKAAQEGAEEAAKLAAKGAAQAGAKAGAQAAIDAAAVAAAPETGGISLAAIALQYAAGWLVEQTVKHSKTIALILTSCVFTTIILLTSGCGLLSYTLGGGFGKTTPQPAGASNPATQKIMGATKQATGNQLYGQAISNLGGNISGYTKLRVNSRDSQYIQEGKLDRRLTNVLQYLADRHLSLGISYIVSSYENMDKDPESGDNQLISNVSAHTQGMAADVASVDFVYKTIEKHPECADADLPPFDVVYYGDTANAQSIADQVLSAGKTADKKENETEAGGTISAENSNVAIGDASKSQEKVEAESQITEELLKQVQNVLNTKCGNSTNPEVVKLKQKIIEIQVRLAEFRQKLSNALESLKKLQKTIGTVSNILEQAGQDVPKELNDLNKYLTILINSLEAANRVLVNINISLPQANTALEEAVNQGCDQLSQEAAKKAIAEFDQVGALIKGLPDLPAAQNLSALKPAIDKIVEKLTTAAKEKAAEEIKKVLGEIVPEINTLGGSLGGGSNQLLKLICTTSSIKANTTFKGLPAEAIPIKIAWQDPKPDNPHLDPQAKDDCLTRETGQGLFGAAIGPMACYQVFRPEAQRKTHQILNDLLQYPFDMGDVMGNRITQIITYSQSRDVDVFQKSGILDQIYLLPRPRNFGLFSMQESWAQVHIGY